MNPEINEMKKGLVHQIAEDFNSRFESNDQKLERLRQLQMGEVSLPQGLDIEGEIRIPDVAEMHDMLLGGVRGTIGKSSVPVPVESRTKYEDSTKRKLEEESTSY